MRFVVATVRSQVSRRSRAEDFPDTSCSILAIVEGEAQESVNLARPVVGNSDAHRVLITASPPSPVVEVEGVADALDPHMQKPDLHDDVHEHRTTRTALDDAVLVAHRGVTQPFMRNNRRPES